MMRYAVFSDVHGNLEALTAVLEALGNEKVDRYLCLGDVVGYGADPSSCLCRLQEREAVIVGGNHEMGCIGKLTLEWFNPMARAALLWTRDQLSFTDLDALRRFPLTTTEGPCTLVHGTLRHPERFDYLVDLAAIIDILRLCQSLFCLVGHTHVPCIVEYDRLHDRLLRVLLARDELTEVGFVNDPHRMRYLLNPGSVGQPRDGNPLASCAIIDLENQRLSIRRVPYDVARAQQKIRQAGLPEFLAARLEIGR